MVIIFISIKLDTKNLNMKYNKNKKDMCNKKMVLLLVCGLMISTVYAKERIVPLQKGAEIEREDDHDYVFYKSVSAFRLTVVNDEIKNSDSPTIQVYKKDGKYYYKHGNLGYDIVQDNTYEYFHKISVSRNQYLSIHVASKRVSYYYFFNL